MKSLAVEKLGLELMDSFLPIGSLDQGLDILQIMRNIHIFVSRYGVFVSVLYCVCVSTLQWLILSEHVLCDIVLSMY